MKVYKIELDLDKIQSLACDDPRYKAGDHMHDCTGKSIKKDWEKYMFYIYNPKIKPKDFYNFDGLVFNQKVYDVLGLYLEQYGEFLDIEVENGPELFLFNTTAICDCIDRDNSVYEMNIRNSEGRGRFIQGIGKDLFINNNSERIYKIQFKLFKDNINLPLFMVKDHNSNGEGPYCTDGFFPPEQEFFHIYHQHNLTGLLFDDVELT